MQNTISREGILMSESPGKDDRNNAENPSDSGDQTFSVPLPERRENAEQELVQGVTFETRAQGLSRPLWVLVVLSILSSTFLFALDNTVVADVQPKIIESFNEIQKLPWMSVAFALGAVSVNLLWGKLYGVFNNKPIFLASIFIFEVGSAVCGAAPSMNSMIIGRAVAGLGGSGIYIGAINILTASTRISQRPLYMSFVGATWSAGTVLGPIVGGGFAESRATWRWAFYINLCVAAACAPIYLFLLPSHQPKPVTPIRKRIQSLDFLGTVLFIGTSVALVMAIAFGGTIYKWSSGQIIGLFACSGVLCLLFCAQQWLPLFTTRDHQIFPVHLLGSLEMCLLFAQTGICIACIFIPVYFIPLFFQFVRNDSALEAGVRLLPFVFVAVLGAMINGAMMERFGFYMPWFLTGGLLITAGGALLQSIHLDSSSARVYGYSVITALGSGFFVQAPFSVAQAKVDTSLVPTATAFISCGQIIGIALSLAIATSIFVNAASRKIATVLPDAPGSVIQATIAGAGTTFFKSQNDEDQRKVLEAIVSTIDHVYIMVIVGGAMAVTLSFFMKRERLSIQAGATFA